MGYFLICYYLPIYFQAIEGVSPIASGLRNLPLILSGCKFPLQLKFHCRTDSAPSNLVSCKRWPCWRYRLLSTVSPHWLNLRYHRRWSPLHSGHRLLIGPIHRLPNYCRHRHRHFHSSSCHRRSGSIRDGRNTSRDCRRFMFVNQFSFCATNPHSGSC